MKKIFCLAVALLWLSAFSFAQETLTPEQTNTIKQSAAKLLQNYAKALSSMGDTSFLRTLEPKPSESGTQTGNNDQDQEPTIEEIPYKERLIDVFFETNDIYVCNDVFPYFNKADHPQTANMSKMVVAETYLTYIMTWYKKGIQITYDNLEYGQIKFNQNAPVPYYHLRVKLNRKIKGTYQDGSLYENSTPLYFYIRTAGKYPTQMSEVQIFSIDWGTQEARARRSGKITVSEGIAAGTRYFDSENYRMAYETLIKYKGEKKLRKNAKASLALAWMYFRGLGTKENFKETLVWLQHAADRKDKYALFYLGEAYYFGYEIKEDERKAYKLYRKAAGKRLGMAEHATGRANELGKGTSKSIRRARHWYKRAVKHGYYQAQKDYDRVKKK
ncbi:tetratricopeptide repeat protein [uncultured Microscilla sp.]|uniref:tetratricopeptide repeat protein n=1 Tax=uncultured Microscilla sp. TaxID=432653 RepID=UPI0026391970|nr:tetratricopeptide repeat protein [uncultured Microscilla sp.]